MAPQHMFNLLVHPDVLPAERRTECQLKALQEADTPYFAAAAAVGLHQTASIIRDDKERAQLRAGLLEVVQRFAESTPLVASWAFLAAMDLMRFPADLNTALRYIDSREEHIAFNSRLWILHGVSGESASAYTPLPSDTQVAQTRAGVASLVKEGLLSSAQAEKVLVLLDDYVKHRVPLYPRASEAPSLADLYQEDGMEDLFEEVDKNKDRLVDAKGAHPLSLARSISPSRHPAHSLAQS